MADSQIDLDGIRAVLERRVAALRAKDASGVAALGMDHGVVYTLAPPLRQKDTGPEMLQAWFDTWTGPLEIELKDWDIAAGSDLAFAHGLVRLAGTKTDGTQPCLWFRSTLGLRKIDGAWKIAHEHESVPFHMDGTLRAAVDLTPEDGDPDTAVATNGEGGREIVLERVMDLPREKLFKVWGDPALLKQWWCPRPWTTPEAVLDFRTGGTSRIVMRSPEGKDFPGEGVYLEVVPNERIVFTDAYVRPWVPAEKPFFTAVVTFEDAGPGRTLYRARALHWTVADRKAHERMGFHEGWGKCADQMAEVAARL